ncbi:MAG: MmgE/PrpD family protein [Crenarchaeota archaeon]|nr:MmgE/PrpD family protein [Thermoproteota archaeon]
MSVKDDISRALVKYALELSYDDLSEKVVEEVKIRVLDSIGVAVPAYFSDPIRSVRCCASSLSCSSPLCYSYMFSDTFVPLEWACFLSTGMVRYLDFNDTYLSKEPLHPSDMIGTLLTVASYVDASGKELITSIALAYEVGCRFCDAGSLRVHGWDHVNYITIATTLAVGRLLKLDEKKLSEALSIAATSHAAMRQARAGELSNWKAFATADAVKHAVYSCILAAAGVTGPDKPFRGEMGFIKQLLQNEFDPRPILELENMPKPVKVCETIIKHFPVEIHSQTAVEACQAIRERLGKFSPDDVEEISIGTFRVGYEIIVKDPEKWDPKTKETADHSLPWIVATALLNGEVWLEHYEPDKIRDFNVLSLLKKTKVYVDEEIDRLYPEAIPNKVRVKLKDGREAECRIDYPLGHPKNPMSINDVEAKFRRLVSPYYTKERMREIVNLVKKLEELDNVDRLYEVIIF